MTESWRDSDPNVERGNLIRENKMDHAERPIPVGRLFVEKYGHRWKKTAAIKIYQGKCCWGKCDNDHAGIYMGFPFCKKHWEWVEKKIEEIYEKEQGRV